MCAEVWWRWAKAHPTGLVSAYIFFRNWNQPLEVPAWQILLGVFLVLLYLISATGSMMRIRLRLFESMLSDSLARSNARKAG